MTKKRPNRTCCCCFGLTWNNDKSASLTSRQCASKMNCTEEYKRCAKHINEYNRLVLLQSAELARALAPHAHTHKDHVRTVKVFCSFFNCIQMFLFFSLLTFFVIKSSRFYIEHLGVEIYLDFTTKVVDCFHSFGAFCFCSILNKMQLISFATSLFFFFFHIAMQF